ncbi:MAG: hypothetical protein JXA95_07085 [Spirochaetales bacterium]|nr:hypothetical protein [Spirochaetales bacterium]
MKKRPSNLPNGLFIILILILLISVSTVLFISKRQVRILTDQETEFLRNQLMNSIDWAISPLLDEDDLESVQKLLGEIAQLPSIDELLVTDGNGKIRISSRPSSIGRQCALAPVQDIIDENRLSSSLIDREEGFYYYGVPVRGNHAFLHQGNEIQGVLLIKVNLGYIRYILRPFLLSLVFTIIFLALSLSLLSLYYINHYILKPIKSLHGTLEDVKKGVFPDPLSDSYPGDLTQLINGLMEQLREVNSNWKALKKYSDSQEIKVHDQTLEMEASLKKLKQAQETMAIQEKMASLGQLSAGVAHEINNPTGFVQANLEALKGYYPEIEEILINFEAWLNLSEEEALAGLKESREKFRKTVNDLDLDASLGEIKMILDESLDGTNRIRKIINGLRSYARQENTLFSDANINDVLETSLRLSWNELKYKCEIVKDFPPLPPLSCIQDELIQVFVNLFINASHAIEEKGTIEIRTRKRGEWIIITVADDGIGIPEEVRERIFDPFFTTKEVGKGNGLGLSISLGIINKHGGNIKVKSTPGKGTVFTISLPLDRSDASDE